MSTYFADPGDFSRNLPPGEDDIRLSESVIARYVERYTQPGHLVVDPFAGFGTTLVVAERLGRRALGWEIDPDRARAARSGLTEPDALQTGDVRAVEARELPPYHLCLSSPPYMNRGDVEDPLSGYLEPVVDYAVYVAQLGALYVEFGRHLAPGGVLVVQLQNLRNPAGTTALAFDLHSAIDGMLRFLGEEVLTFKEPAYGYDHGYCLIYDNPAAS